MNFRAKASALALAPLTALLLSCADSPGLGSGTPSSGISAWAQATGSENASLRSAPSLAGISIAILKAPGLERSWGAPQISTSPTGHYRLAYKDSNRPFERLVIYGSPTPYPTLTTPPNSVSDGMVNDELTAIEKAQSWRTVTVMGRPVRWFTDSEGGGADGAYHSTEGFSLSQGGKTGYYRLVIETITDAEPERFQAVSW